MRELTDRELDAVCGGLLNQTLWNWQSNAAVVQQSAGWFSGNTATVNQNNSAINTNAQVFVI